MNKSVKEMKLVLKKDGENMTVTAAVHDPAKNDYSDDYYCLVIVDRILKSSKRIYGVDAAQARILAVEFLATLLSEYTVQSESGIPIDIRAAFS